MYKTLTLLSVLTISSTAFADQFVLFDKTFTFEEKDAVPTKSHLFVNADELSELMPKDWTAPIDYRNGTVHVRIEVLEKPDGDEPTNWSLCYIANQGRDQSYGCTNTPMYTKEGVYEKSVKMTEFWHNESVVWEQGIKQMSLVIKGEGGGKSHAHLRPDLSKFFPTTIRVSMIQVSAGATYDPSWIESRNDP